MGIGVDGQVALEKKGGPPRSENDEKDVHYVADTALEAASSESVPTRIDKSMHVVAAKRHISPFGSCRLVPPLPPCPGALGATSRHHAF